MGKSPFKIQTNWTNSILEIYHTDGAPFLSYREAMVAIKSTKTEIEEVKKEADNAKRKNALLAAKLKELGIDPNSIT